MELMHTTTPASVILGSVTAALGCMVAMVTAVARRKSGYRGIQLWITSGFALLIPAAVIMDWRLAILDACLAAGAFALFQYGKRTWPEAVASVDEDLSRNRDTGDDI